VTANNGTKNASLPNYDMDFPVFTSVTLVGTSLTVSGYVGSAPNQSTFAGARVEIFKSDNDASGQWRGPDLPWLPDRRCHGNFSGTISVSSVTYGDKITGTATDGSNNTSEFGGNATIAGIWYSKGSLAVNTGPRTGTRRRGGGGTDATSFFTNCTWVIQSSHAMSLSGSSSWM